MDLWLISQFKIIKSDVGRFVATSSTILIDASPTGGQKGLENIKRTS
jgi:hypothetical protein